jgi:DNA-directed RNA polymerase subunit RPC12/RpoP
MSTDQQNSSIKICERCGQETDKLYPYYYVDEEDTKTRYMICWSCDHDIINGADYFVEPADILMDRIELQHEYDPINNPSISQNNYG